MKKQSFKDYIIVSCGTLAPELNYLKNSKFLDAKKILYTKPGRHEDPIELESQLTDKINLAKTYTELSVLYRTIHRLKSAAKYLQKAKDKYRKLKLFNRLKELQENQV